MKIQTAFLLLISPIFLSAQSQKFSFTQPKMGSPFTILAFTEPSDSQRLKTVVERAFQRVDTLNQIFSDYDSTSEISQLKRQVVVNQWFSVSEELCQLVQISLNSAQKSRGAFDITIGKVVKLWRKARRAQQLPNPSDIQAALQKTGWQHIRLDTLNRKISFDTEGVELDFGGIVKGYAAQEAVRILSQNGFPICLADAGGDLATGDSPQNRNQKEPTHNSQLITHNSKSGWSVGISLPNSENKLLSQFIYLHNRAIATSGDMYQGLTVNGKRYSHIVNPTTGIGLTHQRNVTIIAPDGTTADWLATACSVLSIRRALRLANKIPDVGLLILENRKGKIKKWSNKAFETCLK
jgi:FAD:protein FMN transferase